MLSKSGRNKLKAILTLLNYTRKLYFTVINEKLTFNIIIYVIFHNTLTYRKSLEKRLCVSVQTFVLGTTNLNK